LAIGGKSPFDLVQEQRDFIEQAFRRLGALDDDRARDRRSSCSSSAEIARPV
jgi:hypothetical protein